YVDALNNKYGSMGFPPYQWSENDSAPWTPLAKPLSECTVAMLVSGGISLCTAAPFDPDARNDHRLDEIDPDTPTDQYQIHDSYYNHADADRDLNCIFPVDRLAELAETGEIGAVAKRHWSGFMGRTYNRSKVVGESAPAFAKELQADAVDLLIAIPA
ncbi:MAG: glycine/sarcosine/betaine reductase selenoprotein B family protein, partial [Alphaproteobacteria bacterium]|nr:glycine/sarcosine/betaine reductase selenoprotein B family protein [Alphaproteobacteria bacterium]